MFIKIIKISICKVKVWTSMNLATILLKKKNLYKVLFIIIQKVVQICRSPIYHHTKNCTNFYSSSYKKLYKFVALLFIIIQKIVEICCFLVKVTITSSSPIHHHTTNYVITFIFPISHWNQYCSKNPNNHFKTFSNPNNQNILKVPKKQN